MDAKYRSRKFLISVIAQSLSTVALFNGLIDGDNYAMITSTNITAYSFSNAATYFKPKD